MKKLLHKCWSKFLTFFGDIKCFRFPLFLVYDPDDFQISGSDTEEIMSTLEPGDIILRGYNRYLDGKFINIFSIDTSKSVIGGDWSHGAIYVGNGKIIHAIAEGVSETNVVEFTRCDRICIFRPRKLKASAIKKAEKFLKENVPYDFNFQYGASSLYCFELAALCYEKLNIPTFNIKKFFGLMNKKDIYVAQSFIDSKDLDLKLCYNKKFDKHFVTFLT